MQAHVEERRHSVLIVDDDRSLRTVIAAHLELGGFETLSANDGPEALASFDERIPDLIVVDVSMPLMDGYELTRRIRRHPSAGHVPIIMLTARTETVDKVAGFEAGADDYIIKPFSPQEMLARVRANIRRMTTDASLQPLTRLPGNIAIETDIRRRLTAGEPWAVLYIDLDNFKAFNDVYGFVHGDEAIQLLATTLAEAVRRVGSPDDFVGHIGGDDFVLVTTPGAAVTIANDVVESFDRDVLALYGKDDLDRGYIATKDRRGRVVRYPIMSLSIAIVSNATRVIRSYGQIGEIAAELKAFAKSRPGSSIATDQRNG